MKADTNGSSAPAGAGFQAPTCRSLGLRLEMRLRNTSRRLGSGATQEAAEPVNVDLRVFRSGELIFSRPELGCIEPGGTLVIREDDLGLQSAVRDEQELLFVARLSKRSAPNAFFTQEHQIVYTHPETGTQAHLLYDQQPLRPRSAHAAPIVLLMPKVWLGGDINTYLLVSNTWDADGVIRQPEPVQLSLLTQEGATVCTWEEQFVFNEARAFDLARRAASRSHTTGLRPQFFNLVGRGGASSFVLFAIVANVRSKHFAVEHSLPPVYYMDGAIAPVREHGCDVRRFRGRAPAGRRA